MFYPLEKYSNKPLVSPRVKLEFPANFSLRKQRKQPSLLRIISPGVSHRNRQNVNSGEEREKTAALARKAKLNFVPLIKIYHDNLNSASCNSPSMPQTLRLLTL